MTKQIQIQNGSMFESSVAYSVILNFLFCACLVIDAWSLVI